MNKWLKYSLIILLSLMLYWNVMISIRLYYTEQLLDTACDTILTIAKVLGYDYTANITDLIPNIEW